MMTVCCNRFFFCFFETAIGIFVFYFYNFKIFQNNNFESRPLYSNMVATCFLSLMASSQDNSNVRVTLSVKWSEEFKPQKAKAELEKVLQTWANSLNKKDCKVLNVSEDGRAVIEIRPAPGAV